MSNFGRLFLKDSMNYSQSLINNKNTGNNALSFHARVKNFGEAQITIPSLKKIDSLEQIQLGDTIVLEEIDEQGTMQSHTGLAHIYELVGDTPTYIFDNHNHALYFWLTHISDFDTSNTSVLHIDQHSDLNTPARNIDVSRIHENDYIREYVNYECQISNFIKPFLTLYPDTGFAWIKSEAELLAQQTNRGGGKKNSNMNLGDNLQVTILDIDLDFRAPEMGIEKFDTTISITRQLIQEADLITIATSPMFIDQQKALDILTTLLT